MSSRIWMVLGIILLGALLAWSLAMGNHEWEGVDAAIVERQAAELGYGTSGPLLPIEGDMLLFAFASGGAIGGFVAGYYWRELFGRDRTTATGNHSLECGEARSA